MLQQNRPYQCLVQVYFGADTERTAPIRNGTSSTSKLHVSRSVIISILHSIINILLFEQAFSFGKA